MQRIAANILYISPNETIQNGVVEIDDQGMVCAIFSLDDLSSESQSTNFFNGILLPFLPDMQTLNNSQSVHESIRPRTTTQNNAICLGEKISLWLLSGDGLFNGNHTALFLQKIL